MTPLSNNARVAGLVYLSLVLIGPVRLIYIPATLFVTDDASATATSIAAHELLFRLGIVTELLGGAILIFLVMALYRLFKEVGQAQAALMVVFGGIMPGVIDFINAANDAAALILVRGADFLSVFDKSQRDALAFLFLRLHHQVDVAAEVLWGLWLLPLALLVLRSGFLPRLLGYWLIIAGISYVALSFTGELLPQSYDTVFSIGSIPRLGELAFALWLLVMGARERIARPRTDASA